MVSALERFRQAERNAAISPVERARNERYARSVAVSRNPLIEGQDIDIQPFRRIVTPRDGSEGPQVPDAPPAPTTNGVSGGNPYPTVLPPLTPEMQSALDARRRAASRAYEQAAIAADDARMQAEAQRLFTEQQIDEATARARREGMASLASRGVARSPLFANPFRRELVRQQQAQLGEAEATLAGTLDQLGKTLQAAQLTAEREYADVGVAAIQARSNLARLLGLS